MRSIYIDLIIIIILSFGFLIGFKRGFTRQLVSILGVFGILILSYFFKRPVALFLANHFPIIKEETLKDINIFIYNTISFALIFFVLSIIFRILIKITNIFEKILKATIILSIPSKILGGILGLVENYILIFICLSCLSLPMFNINLKSNLSDFIIYKTPLINNINNKNKEIKELQNEIENLNIDDETQKIIEKMYN